MRKWIALFGCLAMVSACAGKTKINGEEKSASKGGLTINVDWVKPKSDKFDIGFAVVNDTDKPVIILLNEIQCFRGSARGSVKHTFFNTGERTIDFQAGQMKKFKMVCDHGVDSTGPYKLVIKKVYENPSGDGKTRDKVLVTDVQWSKADAT